jgi:hypothetical protein
MLLLVLQIFMNKELILLLILLVQRIFLLIENIADHENVYKPKKDNGKLLVVDLIDTKIIFNHFFI